jgi:hypothetical protein
MSLILWSVKLFRKDDIYLRDTVKDSVDQKPKIVTNSLLLL